MNWFLPPKCCSTAIFPKVIPGHRDLIPPSNNTLEQVRVDREGLAFDIQDRMVLFRFLGSNWASRYARVKVTGPLGRGSSIVPQGWGSGPNGPGALPHTRGRDYGPYHKARA